MTTLLERLADSFNRDDMPNKFSIYMGKQIREAREGKGLSQEELAGKIYKRRASLSDIENGKMYIDVVSFVWLGAILEKPLRYFILPNIPIPELGEISSEEEQLLLSFRQINDKQQRRAIIAQVRATAEVYEENPKNSESREA